MNEQQQLSVDRLLKEVGEKIEKSNEIARKIIHPILNNLETANVISKNIEEDEFLRSLPRSFPSYF